MTYIPIKGVGAAGVNLDLSSADLPPNAWTAANNIRFLDGMASQFLGHGEVYNSPTEAPQHIMPVNIVGARYWVYATATKTFAVTNTGGVAVHTDITHATPRAGVVNAWTHALLSGVPVLNTGDTSKVPMYWDLNVAHKFVDLPAWPAATHCKSLRSFRNYLVALNITDSRGNLPYMVKWSSPADPGSLPVTWNPADATNDAGEQNLAEGSDVIVDGLQLRDFFMIYKENSIWRMTFVGGVYVFAFQKVLGTSGALNRNCIAEIDGFHVVLTGFDVIAHDGQSATSVLDKEARRYLFQNIDVGSANLCFVFKNPFFNEVFICYPSIGSTVCDRAIVWNYVDKTVMFRDMPGVNHADYGPVDNGLGGTWNSNSQPWNSILKKWDGPDFVPSTARTLLAGANQKLYLMDSSASFDGAMPVSFMERRGLDLGESYRRKLVKGLRANITGNPGETVIIKIGYADDAYADPVYVATMTHVIGQAMQDDCMVTGRFIAIRFESGTAYQWRLDSYTLEVEDAGIY